MSNSLNFFIPVSYEFAAPRNYWGHNISNSLKYGLLEFAENYFYFGKERALVIDLNNKSNVEIIDASVQSRREKIIKTALKIVSYFTVVLPLIMMTIKVLHRAFYRFKIRPLLTDLSEQLTPKNQESVQVDLKVKKIIHRIFEHIDYGTTHDSLVLLSAGNHNRIFTIKEAPDYIFKLNTGTGSVIDERFENMKKAVKVCEENNLDCLVVPAAEKFTIPFRNRIIRVIAERKMDFLAHDSDQQYLFQQNAHRITEAVRQLAIFICKTGYSDVEWRNNPILNEPNNLGQMKFGLIDLEECGSAICGLFGGWYRRGLVGCTSEIHHKVIKEIAEQNLNPAKECINAAIEKREIELKKETEWANFYQERGVITGEEPILVDVEQDLGFSGQEATKARQFLKYINDQMKMRPERGIAGKRSFNIQINHDYCPGYPFRDIAEHFIDKLLEKGLIFNKIFADFMLVTFQA